KLEIVSRGQLLDAAGGRAPGAVERIAQGAQEVPEIVLGVQQPRPAQDVSERFLDEILGLFAGAAEGPGRAVETVDVVAETVGIELARPSHALARRIRPAPTSRPARREESPEDERLGK